jgi:hypothetical protein
VTVSVRFRGAVRVAQTGVAAIDDAAIDREDLIARYRRWTIRFESSVQHPVLASLKPAVGSAIGRRLKAGVRDRPAIESATDVASDPERSSAAIRGDEYATGAHEPATIADVRAARGAGGLESTRSCVDGGVHDRIASRPRVAPRSGTLSSVGRDGAAAGARRSEAEGRQQKTSKVVGLNAQSHARPTANFGPSTIAGKFRCFAAGRLLFGTTWHT